MSARLYMGEKQRQRAKFMEMVVQKKLTLIDASSRLNVSYRQARRIYRRYREGGDAALLHGNQGKVSNRRISEALKQKVLDVYQLKYQDFGPTFAAEKLLECDGLKVSAETLRCWLLEAGLRKRKRRSVAYWSRRERKQEFGELLQFDGSHHDWFEGRARKCCLMNIVDDATGITMSMLFEQETTESIMILLGKWIKKYGIPQSLYCDRKNAFVSNREATDAELLKGIQPLSHFEKSCAKLGIEVIKANSPQAKGRVERNHAVYQDRFVKELRLACISDINSANNFLEEIYLPKINDKFSVPPVSENDAHVDLMDSNLSEIFSFEFERSLSNDFVIRFKNRLFQIHKENKVLPRPRAKILIRVRLDGSISLYHNGQELRFTEIFIQNRKEEIRHLCYA